MFFIEVTHQSAKAAHAAGIEFGKIAAHAFISPGKSNFGRITTPPPVRSFCNLPVVSGHHNRVMQDHTRSKSPVSWVLKKYQISRRFDTALAGVPNPPSHASNKFGMLSISMHCLYFLVLPNRFQMAAASCHFSNFSYRRAIFCWFFPVF